MGLKMGYDPQKHHRRSIRLKGYDYAGGGLYFVTLCAHRDAGDIFARDDVREMVAKEWESVGAGLVPAQKEGTHEGCPYVVMPDHFHALVRLGKGRALGDVIGAFKSRVVHEYIGKVKEGKWPRFPDKIWHRNYYEMIVRSPEAERKIADYIRMNPWRCVQDFGGGLRGMGNPALWNLPMLGICCSRNAPKPKSIPKAAAYLSGFHSPMEQAIFAKLLECKRPVIWCPAWGLDGLLNPPSLQALEENRMLILEMKNREGNLAAAEQRNRFVLDQSERLWLPHVARGGMIERLMQEMKVEGKRSATRADSNPNTA